MKLSIISCGIVGAVVAVACVRAARPAAYGAELAACEQASPPGPSGWRTYVPCCEDVQRRYARSIGECADGGAP